MGYGGRVADYGYGPLIELYTDESERLFKEISEWIPKCMSYKIPDEFWDGKNRWDTNGTQRYCATVENVTESKERNNQRYDIEVKENHNYVTKDIVVSNCRFTQYPEKDRLVFGSRNVEFTRDGKPLPIEETNKQFRHVIKYVQESVDYEALEQVYDEYGELTFFGEALHKHTVEYDWDGKHPDVESKTPNYIGFDIWNAETDEWLPHHQVVEIHNKIGLQTVPVISETTVRDITESHVEIPKSVFRSPDEAAENKFNKEGLAEGIVIKNDTRKTRAKKVSPHMREVNKFGTPNDSETLEDMKARKKHARLFTDTFVTEQRVLKNAHKLVDEGSYDELKMPMMQDLPQRVLTDIMAEEGWNIITHEYEIELTEHSKESIRQLVSDKCSRILRDDMHPS